MPELTLTFVRVIIAYLLDSVTNDSLVVHNSLRRNLTTHKNHASLGNGFYKTKKYITTKSYLNGKRQLTSVTKTSTNTLIIKSK